MVLFLNYLKVMSLQYKIINTCSNSRDVKVNNRILSLFLKLRLISLVFLTSVTWNGQIIAPLRFGLVVSVSAPHALGRGFAPSRVIPQIIKKWYKLPPPSLLGTHVLGKGFGNAVRLSKRPGSLSNCLWSHALKRSPGINHKSRVKCSGP